MNIRRRNGLYLEIPKGAKGGATGGTPGGKHLEVTQRCNGGSSRTYVGEMASSILQEASREAREYVENVMVLQQFAEVKSPFHVSSGRNGHLSLPDENGVKK